MGVKHLAFVHMTDDKAEPVDTWIAENYPITNMLVTGHEKVILSDSK
jgi:hypothetical protein